MHSFAIFMRDVIVNKMILLQVLFAFWLSPAHAQTQNQVPLPQFYLGGDLGLTDSTGPSTAKQLALAWGGRAGFLFYDHVAIGAFVHYYTSIEPNENIAYVPLLAEVIFYPHHSPLDLNSYYIGAGFGTTHMVTSDISGKRSENVSTLALTAGYSIQLWDNWNLGPEVQYHLLYSDHDNFTLLNFFGSLKLFF